MFLTSLAVVVIVVGVVFEAGDLGFSSFIGTAVIVAPAECVLDTSTSSVVDLRCSSALFDWKIHKKMSLKYFDLVFTESRGTKIDLLAEFFPFFLVLFALV